MSPLRRLQHIYIYNSDFEDIAVTNVCVTGWREVRRNMVTSSWNHFTNPVTHPTIYCTYYTPTGARRVYIGTRPVPSSPSSPRFHKSCHPRSPERFYPDTITNYNIRIIIIGILLDSSLPPTTSSREDSGGIAAVTVQHSYAYIILYSRRKSVANGRTLVPVTR